MVVPSVAHAQLQHLALMMVLVCNNFLRISFNYYIKFVRKVCKKKFARMNLPDEHSSAALRPDDRRQKYRIPENIMKFLVIEFHLIITSRGCKHGQCSPLELPQFRKKRTQLNILKKITSITNFYSNSMGRIKLLKPYYIASPDR